MNNLLHLLLTIYWGIGLLVGLICCGSFYYDDKMDDITFEELSLKIFWISFGFTVVWPAVVIFWLVKKYRDRKSN